MFVGNQDGGQLSGHQAQNIESTGGFSQGETTVNHYQGVARLNQRGITFAATAQ